MSAVHSWFIFPVYLRTKLAFTLVEIGTEEYNLVRVVIFDLFVALLCDMDCGIDVSYWSCGWIEMMQYCLFPGNHYFLSFQYTGETSDVVFHTCDKYEM